MEGEGGLTTSTKKEAESLLLNNVTAAVTDATSEVMQINGRYNSLVIAQVIQMDIFQFNKLNPNFDKIIAEKSYYELRLPSDKKLLFLANKPKILEQSIYLLLASASK
jgi:membrane-bound lytic murein transglycosylase D